MPASVPEDPHRTMPCGVEGCERSLTGGMATVREVLCDFHARMWIKRGYTVLPLPPKDDLA